MAVGFSLQPSFEGQVTFDQVPDDVFERIERRLASGLFVPGKRQRAHYRVIAKSPEMLEFESADFVTAYAIGLNHVVLRRIGRDSIAYEVSFARWNRYAVTHAAIIGLVFAIVFAVGLHDRLDSRASWLFWGFVSFWALAWPWLLTAMHRPFAARALESVLREEVGHDSRFRAAS
jgi:hypothetical protein